MFVLCFISCLLCTLCNFSMILLIFNMKASAFYQIFHAFPFNRNEYLSCNPKVETASLL